MAVVVVTDSASYLPAALRDSLGVRVVSMYVAEDGRVTPEAELDWPEFYARLSTTRELPTTSQPTVQDLQTVFAEAVSEDREVLAVLISGGMSGTVTSAEMAARLVMEVSPDARVTVVDSRANCMQEGFAVMAAAEAARSGASLAECELAARESMRRSRFLFVPGSLEYLRRGGRISAAGALLGALLRVAPVLTAANGETGVAGRARTTSRAKEMIARLMRADVNRLGLKRVVVQTIGDIRAGTEFAREHIEPIAGYPVEVVPIGPVVGLHVGPAVGVAYETLDPFD